MAKQTFDEVINEILGDKKPVGKYKVPNKSGTLPLHTNDKDNFNKLAMKTGGNAGVGKGEIALFWLFGKKASHQGGGKADLVLDGKPCEVKSYPNHDKMTLGKFKSSYTALELITFLFSFNNLFMKFGTSKSGSTNYKSLLTFGTDDLVKSLEYYNVLKIIFTSADVEKAIKKISKTTPQATDAFKNIGATCRKFTKQLKALGIYNKTKKEEDRQKCAAGIISFLLKVKLTEKPGDKGYMVNCLKNKETDIHFHKVIINKIDASYKTLAKGGNKNTAAFSVSSGEIQINAATAIFK